MTLHPLRRREHGLEEQSSQPKRLAHGLRHHLHLAGNRQLPDGRNRRWSAYDDPTDRDVFYEQTFGLFSMALAVMALTTALVVTGRPLSILAMTSSGVMIVMMSLHYMAGEAVDYGYNDPVVLGVVLALVATMGVSGYLHLNDD